MVRTRVRSAPPQALIKNAVKWTARWQAIYIGRKNGDWATPSAKKALGAALRELAHGKCVYCEGVLGAQTYLGVDHYIAKALNPERAFDWTNLLPACEICNSSKRDEDHGNALLKADEEDPEPFFWLGPEGQIEPHPSLDDAGRLRALETIRLCQLNRGELRSLRYETLKRVRRFIQLLNKLGGGNDIVQAEWADLSDPTYQYKLTIRHTLVQAEQDVLANRDRALFDA